MPGAVGQTITQVGLGPGMGTMIDAEPGEVGEGDRGAALQAQERNRKDQQEW
jgi:hypothetical protein